MAIIHTSPEAKRRFDEDMDRQLEEFITKMEAKPIDPAELYISDKFKSEFLMGYYIKHANTVDKRLAKNPNQENYLCIFFDWIRTPSRILKHYGFGNKLDNYLLIRHGTKLEKQQQNGCNRMLRKCIYNWTDAVEYHIRLGLPVSPLLGMAKDYVLDGKEPDIKAAAEASLLPLESNYTHRPELLNKGQTQLML